MRTIINLKVINTSGWFCRSSLFKNTHPEHRVSLLPIGRNRFNIYSNPFFVWSVSCLNRALSVAKLRQCAGKTVSSIKFKLLVAIQFGWCKICVPFFAPCSIYCLQLMNAFFNRCANLDIECVCRVCLNDLWLKYWQCSMEQWQ